MRAHRDRRPKADFGSTRENAPPGRRGVSGVTQGGEKSDHPHDRAETANRANVVRLSRVVTRLKTCPTVARLWTDSIGLLGSRADFRRSGFYAHGIWACSPCSTSLLGGRASWRLHLAHYPEQGSHIPIYYGCLIRSLRAETASENPAVIRPYGSWGPAGRRGPVAMSRFYQPSPRPLAIWPAALR